MSELGSFTLVLHGHMPWVMNHGRWPHGESWLYEAALEVYLPLLQVIDDVHSAGARAPLTLGLTPVLLEQLRLPTFKAGFEAYLEDRLSRARADVAVPEVSGLAQHWERELSGLRERWKSIDGDIVGAWAAHAQAGSVELLSSFAAHGYAALIKHNRSVRAQLRTGLDVSERHLGFRPKGVWLPECSFAPAGPWSLPVLGGERVREGVDRIMESEGVTHFFVESHLYDDARSEGIVENGGFRKVGWDEATKFPGRGWRSVLEPHLVGSHGGASRVTAFARHPKVGEQVWSADAGYPGNGAFLEFHKRRDGDGHRYWRVTSRKSGLGEKLPYEPDAIQSLVHAQASHFCALLRDTLGAWRAKTGRHGNICAPFDAELFGHWWHEGPAFIREVLKQLHFDPAVRAMTAAERLASHPPDKVAWLPEGSWGEGGDHRVWLNDQTRWTWEAAHRAEDRFLGLEWRCRDASGDAPALLKRAAKELLLLQASDWQFVIHSGGAVDYGYRRFSVHLDRFDHLCGMVDDALAGRGLSPLQRARLAEVDASDPCFADVNPSAWR